MCFTSFIALYDTSGVLKWPFYYKCTCKMCPERLILHIYTFILVNKYKKLINSKMWLMKCDLLFNEAVWGLFYWLFQILSRCSSKCSIQVAEPVVFLAIGVLSADGRRRTRSCSLPEWYFDCFNSYLHTFEYLVVIVYHSTIRLIIGCSFCRKLSYAA